jgi:hypothetical protein
MSKPEAAHYRTTNWKSYNDALRRRGSLLIWLDRDMEWIAPKAGRPGRPPMFSDAAIQFCLMVKVLFVLPLRQTTGMVASILEMAGLVHLAMDTATGDIRAVEFTSSREGDSPVLPDLLDQIPPDEQIGTVTGDGAFDTRRCHTAILDRGGTAVIPIRKNGRLWKEDCPAARARNDILRASRRFGRANWKQWSGYHVRSRIEAKMRCLKSFGERIASRDPDRQTAEVHIRIVLMNRFNVLGTAVIERVA